jgi:F0F1-type ATP synthase membrane subunit b/b'
MFWEENILKALKSLEERIMSALDDAVAQLTTAVNNAIAAGIGGSSADDNTNIAAIDALTAQLDAATPAPATTTTPVDTTPPPNAAN